MSLYILDTDIWTLYRKLHPLVEQRVAAARSSDHLAITIISAEEQLSGWYARLRQARTRAEKARRYQELTDTVMACREWDVLPFPEPALLRFEQLFALKLNVGKMDLCITAITLEFSGILFTRNLRDFQRVPGLTLENWAV